MSIVSAQHDMPASAPAGGSLALGAYLMLLGVIFYVPFALSPLPQQNDVFMTNLFLGLGAFAVGSMLVAANATHEAAHMLWLTAVLAIAGGVVAYVGVETMLYTLGYAFAAPIMAGYTAVLLALSLIAGRRSGHFAVWFRALLVGLAGAGLLTLYYALLGGQYYDAYGLATYLPRFVDGQTSGLALLLGIGVFFLGHFWARQP